jgi:hypothetical protein
MIYDAIEKDKGFVVMASNPPFHMEDHDDEDFFDKLVEDDVGPDKSCYDDEGNDSDDVKAFSNLGVDGDDIDSSAFGNSSVGEVKEKEEENVGNAQEGDKSFGYDDLTDRGDHGIESGNSAGSSAGKSTCIPSSDVKEKDWNAFNADSSGGVGFGSYSDFFSEFGDQNGKGYHDDSNAEVKPSNVIPGDQYMQGYHDSNTKVNHGNEISSDGLNASVDYMQYQECHGYDASAGNSISGEDVNSSQYWESLYPGWKYDHNTEQWYQVDDHNGTIDAQGSLEVNAATGWTVSSDAKEEVLYAQQNAQSVVAGTLAESGTTEIVPSWNQGSQGNSGYPEHMIFDPQYPGWYYDTIAQEWRSLESYNSSVQSVFQGHENGHVSIGTFSHNGNSLYRDYGQVDYYESQGVGSQATNNNWRGSCGINHQQGLDTLATATATKSGNFTTYGGNQYFDHSFGSCVSVNKDQQNTSNSFGSVPFYNKVNHGRGLANGTVETQCFTPSGNFGQHFNYSNTQFDEQKNFSNDYVESRQPFNYFNQSFQGGQQHSYVHHVKRSSVGRPPHALVTFGFGGKLIIMKDVSLSSSTYGSQVYS